MLNVKKESIPDPLVYSAAKAISDRHSLEILERVVSERKIDYLNEGDWTLLNIAIHSQNHDAVALILALGANVNFPEHAAPIAVAASCSSLQIVQSLISSGANPDGKAGSQSSLWRAAKAGNFEVVRALLAAGANINRADLNGDTPLSVAVQVNEYDVALYLLSQGASPFEHDKAGLTPGLWAAFADLDPTSEKGRARDRLVQALKDRGHPWPPPGPDEVLAMKAAGQWPPHQ